MKIIGELTKPRMGNVLKLDMEKKLRDLKGRYLPELLFAVWVEDVKGDNERALLFSWKEYMNEIVKNPTIDSDVLLKPRGRIYPDLLCADTFRVTLATKKNAYITLSFSKDFIEHAEKLALKYIDLIPKRPWYIRIID